MFILRRKETRNDVATKLRFFFRARLIEFTAASIWASFLLQHCFPYETKRLRDYIDGGGCFAFLPFFYTFPFFLCIYILSDGLTRHAARINFGLQFEWWACLGWRDFKMMDFLREGYLLSHYTTWWALGSWRLALTETSCEVWDGLMRRLRRKFKVLIGVPLDYFVVTSKEREGVYLVEERMNRIRFTPLVWVCIWEQVEKVSSCR